MKRGRQSNKIPEERQKDKDNTLRAENRKLRKQVSQLQKQLARMHGREEDIKDIMEEYEELQKDTELKETKPQCPMCRSYDIAIMEKLVNNIDYYSCNVCSARGKLRANKE